MGSAEDLKHCQEGREEIPNFQVGKELRSTEDLTDCHEDSQGISHCQVGNGLRSLRDLIDCQEGSGKSFQFSRWAREQRWDQLIHRLPGGQQGNPNIARWAGMSR
jgi:hypothetical protein